MSEASHDAASFALVEQAVRALPRVQDIDCVPGSLLLIQAQSAAARRTHGLLGTLRHAACAVFRSLPS
ncbi:hypothetical protein [Xanthomonas hortorum]|uniref:hypothetical protein n=1 Tax=Xanthomonas hortorum TaxID=56454 RepID=UPI00181435C7|nr:hypothetical protein [Xanthomonas hortorum]MCE4358389.1 hypothetical protein [Xanthomonas hortorum pv. taraxaci]NMI52815.1 hypothetical protein [Xanthomonas hortorum pv. taraxaci]